MYVSLKYHRWNKTYAKSSLQYIIRYTDNIIIECSLTYETCNIKYIICTCIKKYLNNWTNLLLFGHRSAPPIREAFSFSRRGQREKSWSFRPHRVKLRSGRLLHSLVINGHFRNLHWWYLPYIRPIFQALISGNIPTKYGLQNGTNVPPL